MVFVLVGFLTSNLDDSPYNGMTVFKLGGFSL